jgi:HEAT repeat protein
MPIFKRAPATPDVAKLRARRDLGGLIKALRETNETQVQREAAEALGALGDARAVEPLIQAYCQAEPKSWLAYAILKALVMIGQPSAGPLIQAIQTGSITGDALAPAVLNLGQISDERVGPALVKLLKHKDWDVVHQAVEALAQRQYRHLAIEPICKHCLLHPNRVVVYAAAEALEKLGWQPDLSPPAAAYWALRGDLQKCVEIGMPAVPPLISELAASGWASTKHLEIVNALRTITGADMGQDVERWREWWKAHASAS